MTKKEKARNVWLWFKRIVYWLCGCTTNHTKPD